MNLCQCIATVLPFEILNFSRVPGCRHVSVNHCSFNLEISNLGRVSRSRLESENHCNLNLDISNMERVHGCKLGAAYDALVGTCEMSVRTQRGFLARSLARLLIPDPCTRSARNLCDKTRIMVHKSAVPVVLVIVHPSPRQNGFAGLLRCCQY